MYSPGWAHQAAITVLAGALGCLWLPSAAGAEALDPIPAGALDPANLESGYPLILDDARLLPDGAKVLSSAVGVRKVSDLGKNLDLNIEVSQGLDDRWQLGFTGSLDNIVGNSDGNVSAEVIYLLVQQEIGNPGIALKGEMDLGKTNDNPLVRLTGIASREFNATTIHGNFSGQWQDIGPGVNDFTWRATAGLSSTLNGALGENTIALGTLSWERTLFKGQQDPLKLDIGIRSRASDDWLWFIGVGTDLKSSASVRQRGRILVGITWDVGG